MADATLPDLSKAVATYLTSHFNPELTARHNSQVVYKIEDLTQLRVDVWPAGLALDHKTRAGMSRMMTLNIAVQQRAKDQEVVDLLTNLCDRILTYMVLKRFCEDTVYSSDGSFIGTDIFDRFVKYDENVYQSVMEINFQKIT